MPSIIATPILTAFIVPGILIFLFLQISWRKHSQSQFGIFVTYSVLQVLHQKRPPVSKNGSRYALADLFLLIRCPSRRRKYSRLRANARFYSPIRRGAKQKYDALFTPWNVTTVSMQYHCFVQACCWKKRTVFQVVISQSDLFVRDYRGFCVILRFDEGRITYWIGWHFRRFCYWGNLI